MDRRPAYEIAQDIMRCFDEETGEIDEDALHALHDEMGDKIEAIGYLVRERGAWAEGAKAEAQRLRDRALAFDRDAMRLSDKAQTLLGIMGVKKVVAPTITASIHKGRLRTVVEDESLVPDEYKRTITTTKVDAAAAAAAIDGGATVPGVKRERGDSKLHWK